MKWEYNRIVVKSDRYINPLNDDDTYPYIEEAGLDGWELVAVDDGVAYFKRPKEDYGTLTTTTDTAVYTKEFLEEMYGNKEETLEEEDKEAASQEDTAEQQVYYQKSHIGELYSRAYE